MKLLKRPLTAVIALYPGIFGAAFCELLLFGSKNEMLHHYQLPVPTIPAGGSGHPYKAQRATAEATATELLKKHGYEVTGTWVPWRYATSAPVKKVKR